MKNTLRVKNRSRKKKPDSFCHVQVPKKGPTRLSRTGAIPVTSHRLFSRSSGHERPMSAQSAMLEAALRKIWTPHHQFWWHATYDDVAGRWRVFHEHPPHGNGNWPIGINAVAATLLRRRFLLCVDVRWWGLVGDVSV